MEEEIVGVNSMIPRGKYMWDSIRKIFVGSKGEKVKLDQEVIEEWVRDNKELRKEVKEIGKLYNKGFEEGYERGLREGQKEAYLSVIQKHIDSLKNMERERLEENIELGRDTSSQKGERSL